MEYFSLHQTLSRNAFFNYIIGHRSAGKTYAFKDWAIRDWLKTGKQWVYVRRYKEELASKETLFDDIAYKYGLEINARGWRCYARKAIPADLEISEKEKKRLYPWKPFGYFIALSKQQQYKGTSLPNVNKLCFDEFIIENKRNKYIPDEVNQFLSLYFTIDRDRKEVKAVILSNAGYLNNPYFTAYDIKASDIANAYWIKRKEGTVLVHYFESENNTRELSNSIIGKASTDSYKEYALNNVFYDANETFVIKDKPKNYSKFMSLTDGKKVIDLYRSDKFGEGTTIWVKYPGNSKTFYSVSPSEPIEGAPYYADYINNMRRRTHSLQVTYNTPEARITWYDFIRP